MATRNTRILIWLLFTVSLSILPVAVTAIVHFAIQGMPTLVDLFGSGELLMICCALSATSIGELILTKRANPDAKATFIFICLGVVLLSVVAHMVIVMATLWHKDYNQIAVAYGSIALFIGTGICSSICIGLSHEK